MIRHIVVSAFFLAISLSPAAAAMKAEEFVKQAAVGNLFEIETSKVASQKTQDAGIRDFAQEMVTDHGKASEKLKSIAQSEGIQVPTQLDQEHQAKLEKLQNAEGDIRSIYVPMQQEAHEKTIQLFETYASEGDNEALKQFAQSTLPVLKDHHEDINALASGAKMTK